MKGNLRPRRRLVGTPGHVGEVKRDNVDNVLPLVELEVLITFLILNVINFTDRVISVNNDHHTI